MLLVHQAGSVKVGEVVRYTVTYTPSADRVLPTPASLHLKVKNTCAIPLRAAWIHGPYALHVSAYPATFNPHHKADDTERDGSPQYEPMLKAGGSWQATLTVPDAIRQTGADIDRRQSALAGAPADDEGKKSVTWIVEVASQIMFSTSASVEFEILVGRDERSLDLGFAAVAGHGHGGPGQVKTVDSGKRKSRKRENRQSVGVYSKAIRLVVEDTEALWNKPELPTWDDIKKRPSSGQAEDKQGDGKLDGTKKRKKIHLVVVTHGLHSNVGADMLFLKESIDATVKEARLAAKDRKESYKSARTQERSQKTESEPDQAASQENDTSTAPLSGGQEDLDLDEDDGEETIVRGFSGNAVKTENGIQYLGKRLAKYVLKLTYPDQPFLPVKKSISRSFTDSFKSPAEKANRDGKPSHQGSSVHLQKEQRKQADSLAYQFTSISFIGHSLGGLIQTYAIAYIHKHSPTFFAQIEPVNFVTMAAPMLGLSNENPMYVRFALDFGLVGRTGQDLGLTWRPPVLAKGGWNAMISGLSNGSSEKESRQPDPGAKPLLRILPTGPAHQVLKLFRNRTVYSNVVNDGIVPLRTSCLLFLDWRGLGKVEKARRGNGLIGTMAEWGWAELTGTNMSSIPANVVAEQHGFDDEDDDDEHVRRGEGETVPQPDEDETVDDNKELTNRLSLEDNEAATVDHHPSNSLGMLDTVLGFFRSSSGGSGTPRSNSPQRHTSRRQMKAFKRAQTIRATEDDDDEDKRATASNPTMRPHMSHLPGTHAAPTQPVATKGESYVDEETGALQAPPKTSIFESAGDILHPPLPSIQWITDPSTRARTIFHDRVYHPEDIPRPPAKRQGSRIMRTFSSEGVSRKTLGSSDTVNSTESGENGGMKVEEKIARAYHHDLSWRKVLVRLEPDAHNNMIVRRMFANAYGWPVIKHLCDTHFADTYSAQTRDEAEPARERAPPMDEPIPAGGGEQVIGQTDKRGPDPTREELREAQDELADLGSTRHASYSSAVRTPGERPDSVAWDDSYFDGSDDDNSDVDDRGFMQKLINPHARKRPEQAPEASRRSEEASRRSEEMPPSTPLTVGHRGLAPVSPSSSRASASHTSQLKTPPLARSSAQEGPVIASQMVQEPEPIIESPGSTAEVGMRKSLEGRVAPRRNSTRGSSGVAEVVARMSLSQDG